MDVDLHGPTVPVLAGMTDRDPRSAGGFAAAVYSENLKVMSMATCWTKPTGGHLARPVEDRRDPQFIGDVAWGSWTCWLSTPLRNRRRALTVAQTITGAEALIVTTPQEVSLADVRKSISFCRAVDMPILGIVET
jgi:Mrp family chromosome partitioning ATPase